MNTEQKVEIGWVMVRLVLLFFAITSLFFNFGLYARIYMNEIFGFEFKTLFLFYSLLSINIGIHLGFIGLVVRKIIENIENIKVLKNN